MSASTWLFASLALAVPAAPTGGQLLLEYLLDVIGCLSLWLDEGDPEQWENRAGSQAAQEMIIVPTCRELLLLRNIEADSSRDVKMEHDVVWGVFA